MAYMTAKSGSDWKTIRVKAVGADGAPSDLPDVCDYVRFSSLSWTRDGGGFFYNRCARQLRVERAPHGAPPGARAAKNARECVQV